MTSTENKPQISAAQLFCLLMLSRISAEIVYPRSGAGYFAETLLAIIVTEVLRLMFGLPVIIYSFKGRDFYRSLSRKNKFLGYSGAIIAALLLLGAAYRTINSVSVFAGRNLLLGAPTYIMIGFTVAFAVYAAFNGIEAIARSGVLFLVGAAIVTLIVVLADIRYMRADGVSAPARAPYADFLEDVIERFLRGGEYIAFAVLLPYVKRKRMSSGGAVLYFALFSAIAAVVLCGFYALTLREVYGLVEFPFTAAASMADIVLLKRLDAVSAAAWTLCAAMRTALLVFCSWKALLVPFSAMKSTEKRKQYET